MAVEAAHLDFDLIEEQKAVYRFKLQCMVIIFLTAVVGGVLPIKLKVKDRLLSFGNTLSGGFFLAAGFCHMLSESVEGFAALELDVFGSHFPYAYFLCMVGILLTFFMEKVLFSGHSHSHSHSTVSSPDVSALRNEDKTIERKGSLTSSPLLKEVVYEAGSQEAELSRGILKISEGNSNDSHGSNMYVLGLLLSVHSLIEGIALGVEDTLGDTTNILIAISGHKIFDAFAFGISLVKNNTPTDKIIKYVLVFALTTPLGILMGFTFLPNPGQSYLAEVVKAISSGTFIYIALVEVILEEFEHPKDKFPKLFLLITGVCMMTFLSARPHGHAGHQHIMPEHTHEH